MDTKHKLAIILWKDASNHAVEWRENISSKLATIVSVGFIVHESTKAITLVQSVCVKGPGKGSSNNAMTIPMGCIKRIREIKY